MFKSSTTVKSFCPHPFQRLKVNPEGFASMCCFQYRGCLGNILDSNMEDIWFGVMANEIRETTLKTQLHEACLTESCPYRHTKLQEQQVDFFAYPREFELDLPTQHCNIGGEDPSPEHPACLMCERHLFYHKHIDRLDEVCLKLKPYVRYIRGLHIQGIAEAFWKDRIFEILDLLGIDDYKNRIIISTTTNGTILTKSRRERWFSYPNSSMTFSIDASTPETFKLIRRVDMYEQVIDCLLAYSAERGPGHRLMIHNNINLLNINEVTGMVELAARAKVDCIDFNATYAAPGICVDDQSAWLFHKAQERILEVAKSLNVRVSFMRNLALDYPIKKDLIEITMPGLKEASEKLDVPLETLYKMVGRSPHTKILSYPTL